MATEVIVPRMGWSMEEGTFQEWLKRDGERVEVGDMLFVMEGNKTAQEVESFDAGYLRLPPDAPKPGDAVVVGQRLAFLADEDDLEPWKDAPGPRRGLATRSRPTNRPARPRPKPSRCAPGNPSRREPFAWPTRWTSTGIILKVPAAADAFANRTYALQLLLPKHLARMTR